MAELNISIPGQPVPKARARTVISKTTGSVRTFTPARTKAYEKLVRDCAWLAVRRARWGTRVNRMVLEVAIYRSGGRFDLDNVIKSVMDGLNGIVWHDDRQVYEIKATMHDVERNPRVELTVRDLP